MPGAGHSEADEIGAVMANMPRLLADMVRSTVEGEQRMTIVAEIASPEALADAITGRVDVIITATSGESLAPPFRAALFGPRAIPVVAISVDGSIIDVYGHSVRRGYGLQGLIGLIREAVAGSRPRGGT
jgi:hypothetical protein